MTIPALLVDFPSASSSEYSTRATLLGRQWPLCWNVGNQFFRPISTLSTLGYVFCAYAAGNMQSAKGDWRFFAISALLGLGTILHSAINMQPLNDKLGALAGLESDGREKFGNGSVNGGMNGSAKTGEMGHAEVLARKWAKGNLIRVVFPMIGGALALSQAVL